MPPVEELSIRVEEPVPPETNVMLAGFKEAVNPAGADAVRETVPLNPPMLVTLRVEVDVDPERKLTVVGEAVKL